MANDKSDLVQSSSVAMQLTLDPRAAGIPGSDGRWRWEIVAESTGKMFIRVQGDVAEYKSLRFTSPLTAEDAMKIRDWLSSHVDAAHASRG